MVLRMLAAVAIVAMAGNVALAQQNDTPANAGYRHLSIEMTGELAKEYARRTGAPNGNELPDGLQIQISGTLAQQLDNGQLRIEHTSHLIREDGLTRLVTLTATVDPQEITTHVTPKGTAVSASPIAESVPTTEETKTRRLKLSSLKNVKLRTWTLSEEIGE